MADPHNLSTDALVRKVLTDEHADLVREAVSFLCHQIMEAEVSAQVGASLGERAPEQRTAQRNGYRQRPFDTRAGSLELFIPRLRQGSYFPSFLEPRTRSEQALVAVVMEAYVNGVSTRKVERVVEQLGIASMSKSPGLAPVRGARMSGSPPSASARWRAATRTCGSTPRWRRCAGPTAGCGARPWWSPTRSTRPATAR